VSEFLTLDSHDNLDSIKRVKSEIVGESSSSGDLQHQTVLISNPNILDLFESFKDRTLSSFLASGKEFERTFVASTFSNDLSTSSMRALIES